MNIHTQTHFKMENFPHYFFRFILAYNLEFIYLTYILCLIYLVSGIWGYVNAVKFI